MDRNDHDHTAHDWENADRSDHLFSRYDFMDDQPQSILLRSVTPTSCPPGVSPALDDAYDLAPGALRAPSVPTFEATAVERPTTRPPRR